MDDIRVQQQYMFGFPTSVTYHNAFFVGFAFSFNEAPIVKHVKGSHHVILFRGNAPLLRIDVQYSSPLCGP